MNSLYHITSVPDTPISHYQYDLFFFLRDREKPVGIARYNILPQDDVDLCFFWTVNWTKDEIVSDTTKRRLWEDEYGKKLYPGVGIVCFQSFIEHIRITHPDVNRIWLDSVYSAIGFYRKLANRLLTTWDIVWWRQWSEGSARIIQKIPMILFDLGLDIFPQFANPHKFTFQITK